MLNEYERKHLVTHMIQAGRIQQLQNLINFLIDNYPKELPVQEICNHLGYTISPTCEKPSQLPLIALQ